MRFFAFFLLLGLISQPLFAQQVQSFDYSQIKPHPRLLLLQNEEEKIASSLRKSAELRRVDEFIRQQAELLLVESPLTYKKIGIRLLGVSRTALLRLYYLAYTYRMSRDERFLVRADKELNALCDFKDWNPTHFLDVGEMSMALAIGYDWLYADLPATTRTKVEQSILAKAFQPSYNKKQAWFLEAENNWNSVCNAGLVYAALAIFEHAPDACTAIIERATQSVKRPLKAYAPDGNYPEGPSYWNYGTTFQMMLSAALESALGTDLNLAQFPGFMHSAYYMNFAVGSSGYFFNYADGGQNGSGSTSLFWFAKKLNNPSLIFQELALIRQGRYTEKLNTSEGRYLPNVLVFAKDMDLQKVRPLPETFFVGHGITPVVMVRTNWEKAKCQYLGLKAGTASAPHAHQDQGSFVYDVDGLRWAMDFGMQNYESIESQGVNLWNMKQDSPRWGIFRYNNFNHNTLSINNQLHNVKGFARITKTLQQNDLYTATVDLSEVLNRNAELKNASRTILLKKDSYLLITDSLSSNEKPVSLRWNMVTPAKASILNSHTIQLSQKGKLMYLVFESDLPLKLAIRPSEVPAESMNELTGKNYEAYNANNPGTTMLGFDAQIPANRSTVFKARLTDKL
jgi:hypothetical protein